MREFSVSAAGITVVGATTLVFINPPAAPAANLKFMRHWVGQSANATSAQQRVQIVTQVTAFPTLTAATPSKINFADTASIITGGTTGAAGTAGINASVEGAGTKTIVWEDDFNVLNGWLLVATPPEGRVMPAGAASGQGLFLPVAPSTLTNWAFGQTYAEV